MACMMPRAGCLNLVPSTIVALHSGIQTMFFVCAPAAVVVMLVDEKPRDDINHTAAAVHGTKQFNPPAAHLSPQAS